MESTTTHMNADSRSESFCSPLLFQEFYLLSQKFTNSIFKVDSTTKISEHFCIEILQECSKFISSAMKPNIGKEASILERANLLQNELKSALSTAENIKELKAKANSLTETLRSEKKIKLQIQARLDASEKSVLILSEHIEKLMKVLKIEVVNKSKLFDQLKVERKINLENQLVLQRSVDTVKVKDRLISELRQGSKVLEDQLLLMDEKFIELRSRFELAREYQSKHVEKAKKVASTLRLKFALAMGNGRILDEYEVPPERMKSFPSPSPMPPMHMQRMSQSSQASDLQGTAGFDGDQGKSMLTVTKSFDSPNCFSPKVMNILNEQSFSRIRRESSIKVPIGEVRPKSAKVISTKWSKNIGTCTPAGVGDNVTASSSSSPSCRPASANAASVPPAIHVHVSGPSDKKHADSHSYERDQPSPDVKLLTIMSKLSKRNSAGAGAGAGRGGRVRGEKIDNPWPKERLDRLLSSGNI